MRETQMLLELGFEARPKRHGLAAPAVHLGPFYRHVYDREHQAYHAIPDIRPRSAFSTAEMQEPRE